MSGSAGSFAGDRRAGGHHEDVRALYPRVDARRRVRVLGSPSATAPTTTRTPVSIVSGSSTLTTTAYATNPVTVAVGRTVTWTNNDSVAHTSVANNGACSSGTIAPGGTFSMTFPSACSFPYHCSIHPGDGRNRDGAVTLARLERSRSIFPYGGRAFQASRDATAPLIHLQDSGGEPRGSRAVADQEHWARAAVWHRA